MACEHIKTPTGHVIVCGGRRRMSKEELNATEAAIKFIEATRQSIPRITLKGAEADALGLGVLAREYDYIAGQLDRALALQVKTLKGKVPQGFQ
jgi:hypothetical protein